jgi:hypothetical protein
METASARVTNRPTDIRYWRIAASTCFQSVKGHLSRTLLIIDRGSDGRRMNLPSAGVGVAGVVAEVDLQRLRGQCRRLILLDVIAD